MRTAMLLITLPLAACLADDDVTVETQAITNYRADYHGADIQPDSGPWGEWSQELFCAAGSYAQGFDQRVEASVGSRDDTGLNTVRLACHDRTGKLIEKFETHPGLYGSYGSAPVCAGAGNFLTGVRIKLEAPQGAGDDTAANGVQFACKNGGSIAADNDLRYGQWSEWRFCPARTAVCGMEVKVEASRGGGDDTAMNGISLRCCSL